MRGTRVHDGIPFIPIGNACQRPCWRSEHFWELQKVNSYLTQALTLWTLKPLELSVWFLLELKVFYSDSGMRLHQVPKHLSHSDSEIIHSDMLVSKTNDTVAKRLILFYEEPPRWHPSIQVTGMFCKLCLLQFPNKCEHIWKGQTDPRGVLLTSRGSRRCACSPPSSST